MARRIIRFSTRYIQNAINPYGYYFTNNTQYKNVSTPMELYDAQLNKKVKISYGQIRYQIESGQRSKFDIYNILNDVAQQQAQQAPRLQGRELRYAQFINKLRAYHSFDALSDNEKQISFRKYQELVGRLNRKRNFNIKFIQSGLSNDLMLFILTEALQAVKERMNKAIYLHVNKVDGTFINYPLGYDTIDYFNGLLEGRTQQELHTSQDDLFETQNDWDNVDVSFFKPVNAGGFFPFINKSSLD